MTTEIVPVVREKASWGKGRIKLIGVGTAGIQVVNYIFKDMPQSVMAISCDTDADALDGVANIHKVLLGESVTQGRGCMRDPEKGRAAAKESIEDLKKLVGDDTEMVFFIAGVGEGTGSGALPVIAEELLKGKTNVSSIAILLYPFSPAGKRVRQIADEAIEEIKKHVSAVIVVDNDNIAVADRRFEDILKDRNNFIKNIIQGIIYSCNPGLYFSIKPGELGMLFGQGKEAHVGISIQTKIDKPDLDEMFEQISSHPYLKHILTLKNASALFVSFLWHPSVDITGSLIHTLKKRLEKESPDAEFLVALGSTSHLPEKSAMLLIIEVVDKREIEEEEEKPVLWNQKPTSLVEPKDVEISSGYADAHYIPKKEPIYEPENQVEKQRSRGQESVSPQDRRKLRKEEPSYLRQQRSIPGLFFGVGGDAEDEREVPNPRKNTIPYIHNKPD
ncbi:MAG: hypothetical protein GXO48_05395 [Chlorobi bacterium]|nr:hypothetical protein [Chlorobiota bacterium]